MAGIGLPVSPAMQTAAHTPLTPHPGRGEVESHSNGTHDRVGSTATVPPSPLSSLRIAVTVRPTAALPCSLGGCPLTSRAASRNRQQALLPTTALVRLFWGTGHVSVRAKYAAISGLWPQHCSAGWAIPEELAGICGHECARGGSALGACNRAFEHRRAL